MPELLLALFLFALIYGGLVQEHRKNVMRRGLRRLNEIHSGILSMNRAIGLMARASAITCSTSMSYDEKRRALDKTVRELDEILGVQA